MVKFYYVGDKNTKEPSKTIEKSPISSVENSIDIKPIVTIENPKIENFENFEPGAGQKKSKIKSVEIELNENDIEIESDDLRTSYRLMAKKTNRDNVKETVNIIKEFLNTHEVVEVSKKKYVFRAK